MVEYNGKKTILVVDDDDATLNKLASILSDEYTVHLATNGRDALELVKDKTNKPDIILLDIGLPKMDGFEVCRQLKSDHKTKDIPVIFVSVMEDTKNVVKGLKIGAIDYITKPFEGAIVLARVKIHWELQHKNKGLKEVNKKLESIIENLKNKLELSEKEKGKLKNTKHKLSKGSEISIKEQMLDLVNREIVGLEQVLNDARTINIQIINNNFGNIAGDTITNNTTSIYNETIYNHSYNRIKNEYGEFFANALEELKKNVDNSGNVKAGKLFDSFNEELSKPSPERPILKNFWDKIVIALPIIEKSTEIIYIIEKIINLF